MTIEHNNLIEHLPQRHETRFELPIHLAAKAIELLSLRYTEQPHDAEWTQTLYLADRYLNVPTDKVVRARKYAQLPLSQMMNLSLDDDWLFELKDESGHKSRVNVSLEEMLLTTSYPEMYTITDYFPHTSALDNDKPLLPIAATQSHRKHFIGDNTRITVDQNLDYYGFDWGDLSGEKIGQKQSVKIETKEFIMPNADSSDNASVATIHEILTSLGAEPMADKSQEKELRKLYGEFLKNHD